MSERNGRPGRAYDENHDNWSAWTDRPAEPKPSDPSMKRIEVDDLIERTQRQKGLT